MSAKEIVLRPILSSVANALVKRLHYSGTYVRNSQLHIGVYYNGKLEGALQFGPSLDKRKISGLVAGTGWNQFIELNRMAFSDVLPRNSESRAIAVACRLLKTHAPHLKWIITFADATQCGDGTIYRASGFLLTQIKQNDQIWELPDGTTFNDTSIRPGIGGAVKRQQIVTRLTVTKGQHITDDGASSMRKFKEAGAKPKTGFQLRYLKFLDESWRTRLTVPVLPYSAIIKAGAAMYKGERSAESGTAVPTVGGGVIPTRSLQ